MALHNSNPRTFPVVAVTLIVVLLYFSFGHVFPSSPQYIEPRLESSLRDPLEDVYNETLGFEKIFVLNLPSRTDRRDSMSLAAALTGLRIEYVDGVKDVDEKTLPFGADEANLSRGYLGSWRAHLNVIRKIVEQNITSALVLEDDADWDLRIKSQMHDFAKASRQLIQPLPGTSKLLDPTFPQPLQGQEPTNFNVRSEDIQVSHSSPYGDIDRWDLLWVGHCGCRFPVASDQNVPLGRAVVLDDQTVPEPQHIDMQFGTSELVNQYLPHTRVVSRARMNTCTLGYALSQLGARRFLYELGLHKMTGNADIMFRSVCDGDEREDRPIRTCLTVQPQLFQHHRPVASKATFSDITDHGREYNARAFTRNIRWSTQLNLGKIVSGETDYIDLFKDGEPADTTLEFG